MEVQVSGALGAQLKSASKKLGFGEKEIVKRAVLFYLDSVEKEMDLSKEFAEWDSLSDEALSEFEDRLSED
ncbi:MAG: hypothetical protein JXB14_00600 [Candidatus Altiarchaeota archaeon]|nr:hypothetical protein [Candidatus Altiarchaeota archaeon]